MTSGKEAPAMMRPSQKGQRQLTVEMNPDMKGDIIGPTAVHYIHEDFISNLVWIEFPFEHKWMQVKLGKCKKEIHTDINQAIVRPLTVGLSKTSEKVPVMMAIGALAAIPLNSLKTSRALKVGARAHAIAKTLNKAYPIQSGYRRPYCSDNGPNSKGPRT